MAGSSQVSIPFIAGQWSLLIAAVALAVATAAFQSPSLRGSGRFESSWEQDELHALMFQSPSLRGSGRFGQRSPAHRGAGREFQSPSLRGSGRFCRPWPPSGPSGSSFNPLHCGAVVASCRGAEPAPTARVVSIPFIAGQWSLLVGALIVCAPPPGFNPLHCGAVVASYGRPTAARPRSTCFNPLHCGAVVASAGVGRGRTGTA